MGPAGGVLLAQLGLRCFGGGNQALQIDPPVGLEVFKADHLIALAAEASHERLTIARTDTQHCAKFVYGLPPFSEKSLFSEGQIATHQR
ncbi:hypothetical protein FIU96_00650 [Marinobacter sp. THAF39]|nr:hypothetical protein FIV08_00650 [Marinobacter sp. THAF197a]QFT49138.1 hypothetical protein FIU96_00650 [Marinobacter sp. THAF39]